MLRAIRPDGVPCQARLLEQRGPGRARRRSTMGFVEDDPIGAGLQRAECDLTAPCAPVREGRAHPHQARLQVKIAPLECGDLTPSAGSRRWLAAQAPGTSGHNHRPHGRPRPSSTVPARHRPLSGTPREQSASRRGDRTAAGSHKPVASDAPDWTASYTVGQLEHLGDGQHRPFYSVLFPAPRMRHRLRARILSSSTAVVSNTRSSRYHLAAIDTDTPSCRRPARQSRIIGVESSREAPRQVEGRCTAEVASGKDRRYADAGHDAERSSVRHSR
jgi:hypothetical protein